MNDWPFADPPDTLVFTTQPVLDGATVLSVHHDQDGDWQVLCGTTLAVEDARMVHLVHLVGMLPSLARLAGLRRGWSADQCDDRTITNGTAVPPPRALRVRAWLRRN